MEAWAAAKKALSCCHQLMPGFLAKGHFPECYVILVYQLMIRGAVHRYPGIYLTSRNEIGKIAQHVKKGEERKEGKDGVGIFQVYDFH